MVKFNFKKIKKSLIKVEKSLVKSAKQKYKKFQNKNKLVNSLSIPESQKVYKQWIDTSLTTIKAVRNAKGDYVNKKVKLTPSEIKRAIRNKVTVDEIILTVPRLKKQAQQLDKEVKKIR